jgi:glycosyltransferase involved in cell wall biosynthesis
MRSLLVTNIPPWPVSGGGLQRTNLLHRALSEIGDVDLFLWNRPSQCDEDTVAKLRSEYGLIGWAQARTRGQQGFWRAVRPLGGRLVDRLAHNLGNRQVDFAVDPQVAAALRRLVDPVSYGLVVGRYFPGLTKPGLLDHPRSILDVDDVPSSVYRTRFNAPHTGWLSQRVIMRHRRQLEALEQNLATRPRALWVAKDEDRCLGPAFERARVLPNICWHDPGNESSALPPSNNPVVISVGQLGYPPNLDGVRTFCKSVWPRVLAAVPNAVYRIIGTGMSDALRREFSQRGVEPIGFVETISEAYRTTGFAVAPVYYGGGTNIKVVEALAHGRAVVVSRSAARGFEDTLPEGKALLVADDPVQFATHCIRLLQRPSDRDALAAAGHAAVRLHYSWNAFRHVVHETATQVNELAR